MGCTPVAGGRSVGVGRATGHGQGDAVGQRDADVGEAEQDGEEDHVALRGGEEVQGVCHSRQREALSNIVTSPERMFTLVRDEAHACRSRGLIDNAQYLAIQLQEA